jgi:hypothetical protein
MTDGEEKDEFPLNLYPVLFCDKKDIADKTGIFSSDKLKASAFTYCNSKFFFSKHDVTLAQPNDNTLKSRILVKTL